MSVKGSNSNSVGNFALNLILIKLIIVQTYLSSGAQKSSLCKNPGRKRNRGARDFY